MSSSTNSDCTCVFAHHSGSYQFNARRIQDFLFICVDDSESVGRMRIDKR